MWERKYFGEKTKKANCVCTTYVYLFYICSMSNKQVIVAGGRSQGKSHKMGLLMEEILDKNPKAVIMLAKADGSNEIFENAEFEDVTTKKLEGI